MPQLLTQVYLHIVFSTKHRQQFLRDKQCRGRTHAYLAGICRNHGIVGGAIVKPLRGLWVSVVPPTQGALRDPGLRRITPSA